MPAESNAATLPSPSPAKRPNPWAKQGIVIGLWLVVFVWMGAVTWLSSRPASYFPDPPVPYADKIVHTALFMTGAFFAAGSMLVSFPWRRRVIFAITILGISLFGALDEYHQLSTPGRSGGDLGDWTADTMGAIAGVFLVVAALKILRHRRPFRDPAASNDRNGASGL